MISVLSYHTLHCQQLLSATAAVYIYCHAHLLFVALTFLRALAKASIAMDSLPGVLAANSCTALAINISEHPTTIQWQPIIVLPSKNNISIPTPRFGKLRCGPCTCTSNSKSQKTFSSSIYALPPPYTILVSLTVRDNTHKASCNDRSASSKICCVAPRMTMLQASPKATPENLISYTHTQQQTLNKKIIFSANLVLTNHHLFYQLAMPKTDFIGIAKS